MKAPEAATKLKLSRSIQSTRPLGNPLTEWHYDCHNGRKTGYKCNEINTHTFVAVLKVESHLRPRPILLAQYLQRCRLGKKDFDPIRVCACPLWKVCWNILAINCVTTADCYAVLIQCKRETHMEAFLKRRFPCCIGNYCGCGLAVECAPGNARRMGPPMQHTNTFCTRTDRGRKCKSWMCGVQKSCITF